MVSFALLVDDLCTAALFMVAAECHAQTLTPDAVGVQSTMVPPQVDSCGMCCQESKEASSSRVPPTSTLICRDQSSNGKDGHSPSTCCTAGTQKHPPPINASHGYCPT
ncbi:hypothetical protein CERZMDRAFT_85531 [Cercospora zeae-maydis SCOH1-5]|uniref:Hydrophobin n=1 Tax=Cercospora zeae-maydis SCOH1-5 TaxID=717836 RepID=A0A6A6FDA4_9PEZI|nr:hypothetical protein CERZMDRAFT_85531 [Cercospora zeae-maydis SCOH1-5]